MKKTVIRAQGLTKQYRLLAESINAVKEVDLEIGTGEFVAIMGPSGSGKTTLLDVIGCLDRPSSGSLFVLGKDVSRAGEQTLVRIRRQHIGFIFQEFLLIPSLTVLENVELALYFSRSTQGRTKAEAILKKVGLGHRLHHLPKELSGGERQRVAVARALVTSPQLLIADEPTGNLDTKTSQEIFDVFKALNKEGGLTIVVATHDRTLGSQAGRVLYLKDGRIVSFSS